MITILVATFLLPTFGCKKLPKAFRLSAAGKMPWAALIQKMKWAGMWTNTTVSCLVLSSVTCWSFASPILSFRLPWQTVENIYCAAFSVQNVLGCSGTLLNVWKCICLACCCKLVLAPTFLSPPTSGQEDTAPPVTPGETWAKRRMFEISQSCSSCLPVPNPDSVMWLKECAAFWWDLWALLYQCTQCSFRPGTESTFQKSVAGLTLSLPAEMVAGGTQYHLLCGIRQVSIFPHNLPRHYPRSIHGQAALLVTNIFFCRLYLWILRAPQSQLRTYKIK